MGHGHRFGEAAWVLGQSKATNKINLYYKLCNLK